MAPANESEHDSADALAPLAAPLDLLETDDRLLKLERSSSQYARHLSQIEGSLSTQMLTVSVLEVGFAVFLACLIWLEYRRRTGKGVCDGAH